MKNILITGASSGIGKATAIKFAKEMGDQCQLVLTARRKEKLEEVKKELESMGAKAEIISADLIEKGSVRKVLDSAFKKFGKFDLVFANAGLGFVKKGQDISDQEVEKIIDLNVKSMILTATIAASYMVKENSGHIIMTSSLAGLIAVPQWSVYCASKWAITGFTNGLRMELAPHNIKVTSLHPGLVKNEFFGKGKAEIDLSGQSTVTSEDVANSVYQAAFTNQRQIFIPKNVKTFSLMYRLFPKFTEKLLVKAFKLD